MAVIAEGQTMLPTETARRLVREKRERWLRAVRFEKQDRVPVVIYGDAYAARQAGVSLADYVNDWELALKVNVRALTELGEVDGTERSFFPPALNPVSILIPMKLPGRGLPPDALWQLDERRLVGPEVYDDIVHKGWDAWYGDFLARHFSELGELLEPLMAFLPKAHADWEAAGIPVTNLDGGAYSPMDPLCGARSMKEFMVDLHRMPDKVQAAMDAAMPSVLGETPEQFDVTGPLGWETASTRGSSDLLSPRLWDRFVFPYLLEIVGRVVAAGGVPVLHNDGDWNRDLSRFLEFPARSCILMLDGKTDIFKAREVLGDHMCLKGDVPPSLLAVGTPEQVRAYCRRLIEELGLEGFILSQGCTIPPDATRENVRAMVESVNA